MTVIVESKRLKVTAAMRAFVQRQAERLSKLGQKGAAQIRVYLETVAKKNNDPTANIVTYAVAFPGKKMVIVKKHAVDMYEAISAASREAYRRVRKLREKQLDQHRAK